MALCIMAIARIASLQRWTRSESVDTALPCCLTYDAFVRLDHELACIKQWCEMLVLKLLCLRYYYFIWNLGCNNFNHTPMYGNVFVNSM